MVVASRGDLEKAVLSPNAPVVASALRRPASATALAPSCGEIGRFCSLFPRPPPLYYNFTFRSRRALPMTETELRLIAAPAIIGLSSRPKNG